MYSLKEDIIEYIFEKAKGLILPSKENNFKSRFLQSKILLYFVVVLLVLRIITVLIPINFPYNIFFADITKSSLENFINQTRQAMGLKTLTESQKLNQAAQLKAENMVQEQYFNHTSPSGITPWFWFKQAGYNYKYAGENLAVGFYESEEVYNAWLNSASHKANIVNPNYTEVGTAVMKGFGSNNAIVVVQEFGTQLSAKQAATKPVTVQPKTQVVEPSITNKTQEKVLSQETESQNVLESPEGTTANNLSSRLLNSVLYNYDNLLQDIVYGVSSVVIGILLVLAFFNFNFKFKRELVFRAVIIVILLSVATLLNKEIIISLIPHQVII